MTETVQIAVYVAIASLVTQLLVISIQHYFKEKEECRADSRKEKIERETNDRSELRQCLSDFFGLLGANESIRQNDNNNDEQIENEWSVKYHALFWKLKSYIPDTQKDLLKKLDDLTDNVFSKDYDDKYQKQATLYREVFDLTKRYINEF